MKKICMIIFTVALCTSFAACSGAKKEENKAKETIGSVAEETPAAIEEVKQEVMEETPAVKPDEVLKDFQSYVKEYVESFNNITKDPAKFSSLANRLQDKVNETEKVKAYFNKKQLADYQEARDLINKVNNAGK
jgi:5'-deoxynucleotidase YfbR-like HD superfamily hydrolase